MLRSMRDLSLLPKAHLHVHLESTIRWDTLRVIGDRNGVTVPDGGGAFGGFGQFAAHKRAGQELPAAAGGLHQDRG